MKTSFVSKLSSLMGLCLLAVSTPAAVRAATVPQSAWDAIVAAGPPQALERFTDLERRILDATAPEQAERLLRGDDPAQIRTLDGGDLSSLLESVAVPGGGGALRFVPVEPCRIADTQLAGRKFFDNEIRHYLVRGETTDYSPQGGNPSGCGILGLSPTVTLANSARAVLLNFRVVDPDGAGNLRAWPSNHPQPAVPLQNYRNTAPALKFNNVAIVPLCDAVGVDPCPFGDIKARLSRSAHLLIEVHGYFVPALTEIAAGPGLVGGGTDGSVALEVDYAGSGSEPTAARSDHIHAESVPPGAIVMWSGSLAGIPAGWALCDGTNGTPDLRDRFVLGAGPGEEPGAVGGAHAYSLSEGQLAPHGHVLGIQTGGNHAHGFARPRRASVDRWFAAFGSITWDITATETATTHSAGSHSHNGTALSTGLGSPIDNRPAFYELAFLIKL